MDHMERKECCALFEGVSTNHMFYLMTESRHVVFQAHKSIKEAMEENYTTAQLMAGDTSWKRWQKKLSSLHSPLKLAMLGGILGVITEMSRARENEDDM